MEKTEMKSKLLGDLLELMMGSHGEKMKPKSVEVQVIKGKPGESLEDVLDKASDEAPPVDADEEMDESVDNPEEEAAEDCGDGKKSLKDFFKGMRG
jgi:hypothetical protein